MNLDETIVVPLTGDAPLNGVQLTSMAPHTACMPGEPLSAHQKMSPPPPTTVPEFRTMKYLRKFSFSKPLSGSKLLADEDGF